MRRLTKPRGPYKTTAYVRDRGRSRELVATISPQMVTLRPLGTRFSLTITWESVWQRAAEQEGARLRAEKAAKRKARQASRRLANVA